VTLKVSVFWCMTPCRVLRNARTMILSPYIPCNIFGLISFTNFNAQFLYSLTICMLYYSHRHVSSINMPIFRRTNYTVTASGIVTLCKRLYSMPDESRLKKTSKYVIFCLFIYKFVRLIGRSINRPSAFVTTVDKIYLQCVYFCYP
jgi:hypothetical protein